MGQRAITIYTPPTASPHITADDDAFIYKSLLGGKDGILGDMTCVKVDNNNIQLSGGGVSNRGHILRIPDDEVLNLNISTGSAGYRRFDSVVAEFVKGGGDVADSYEIKVVQGTAAAATPSAPTLTTSELLNTGDINQIELYRVYINEVTLSTITQIAENIPKRVPNITYGTGDPPTGGQDGDIYIKII